jgi:CHASE1-domain containing sensor protein
VPSRDAVHPVGATVLATRSRPHDRLRRQVPAVVALVVGVGLTLVLSALLGARERDRQRRAFERRTAEIAGTVEKGLSLPVEVLQSIPALFAASVDVSRREFHDFTAGALARHPGIYALEWLPLVAAGERAAYEATARADGLSGFQLTEQREGGTMVRAGDRPFYLPIYYMEPPQGTALGFDVASEPQRLDPPERAALSGATVASPRIRLVEDPPSVSSIAVFHPVYRQGTPLATPQLRRAALRGVAACVFHVAPMVEGALGTVDGEGLPFALLDASAPDDAQPLYESRPGLLATRLAPGALTGSVEIPFADRRWSLRFVAGQGFAADRSLPMAVLAVGLLSSVLVSGGLAGRRAIARLRSQMQAALELGQYTLVERIGEGGMGVVYKARHAMLRRPTAIKLLPPSKSSEALLERFEREVQLTSGLSHPNTIAIYDYGRTAEGVLYYVMEYVDGITLDRLVESYGPLAAARAVFLLKQACGALAEAHDLGLVHRDVKPANLMLCVRGGTYDFVKVLDFGLVKQLEADGSDVSRPEWVVGTPLYMAPESIRSPDRIDPRSDLYALGAVGYFLLTGTQVFTGRNMVEVCGHHLHTEPVPPSRRAPAPIPEALERVILACLAKDPEARPASARGLLAALEAVDGEPWTQEAAREWWERHERRRFEAARRAAAHSPEPRRPPGL